MAKKIEKKVEKHAVAPAKKPEVVTPDVVNPVVMPDDKNLAAQIAEDMNNAELGEFCRVRAGVGLCNIRELNAHGAWEVRMRELFPNRTTRTLRNYMQTGRKFCAAVDLDTQRVYEKMMAVDVKRLQQLAALPAEERKALPVRGVAREAAAGNRVMNALVLLASGDRPAAEKPKAKPLTASERAAAWRDYTVDLAEKVREWSESHMTFKALETDELERFRSALVLVAGLIKDELRRREENGVK